MSAVTTLPTHHRYTASDLADAPDDGNRYELIDGVLIVSPAPTTRHQRASARLHILLDRHCPPGVEVLAAPFDVTLATDTVVQPDLVVARTVDLDETGLAGAPLLAVEILSPSTRLIDLNLKKARYELAACPVYWVVDPGSPDDEPSVTAWELDGDRYVRTARATGHEELSVILPFAMRLVPSELVSPRR